MIEIKSLSVLKQQPVLNVQQQPSSTQCKNIFSVCQPIPAATEYNNNKSSKQAVQGKSGTSITRVVCNSKIVFEERTKLSDLSFKIIRGQ